MDLVFICSPYRGDVEKNIERVKRYCKRASVDRKVPIAPHLYFTQFLNDESWGDRYDGMYMGQTLMEYCKQIWIFADELTEEMVEEIKRAKELKLEFHFYNADMERINDDNLLLHKEIGPAYRRIIAEHYGHVFNFDFEGACGSNCDNCKYRQSAEKGAKK